MEYRAIRVSDDPHSSDFKRGDAIFGFTMKVSRRYFVLFASRQAYEASMTSFSYDKLVMELFVSFNYAQFDKFIEQVKILNTKSIRFTPYKIIDNKVYFKSDCVELDKLVDEYSNSSLFRGLTIYEKKHKILYKTHYSITFGDDCQKVMEHLNYLKIKSIYLQAFIAQKYRVQVFL